MHESRNNYFNIVGNRANFNFKMLNQVRSKKELKSKSKEPLRNQLKTLKRLEETIDEPLAHQRALTTNKKLAPLNIEEPDSARRPKNPPLLQEETNPFRYNIM